MDLNSIRKALTSPIDPILNQPGWKPAAVLIMIYGSVPHVIMTEKPKNMRIHAGEISFPGGKPEHQDLDLCETALRETREEVGYGVDRSCVLGQLEVVHTLSSRFAILPFLAVLDGTPFMHANVEVGSILNIPLDPLLDTLTADLQHGSDMFTLSYKDKIIWGASALMLERLSCKLDGYQIGTP